MPAALERCVKKLKNKGYAAARAWAICTSSVMGKKKTRKKRKK